MTTVHFSDPRDASFALTCFGRNCMSGDGNLGNQSIGASSHQPPRRTVGGEALWMPGHCPGPASVLGHFSPRPHGAPCFHPGPGEALPTSEMRAQQIPAPQPQSCISHTCAFSGPLSDAGDPRNGRTHLWLMSQVRFYQENTPQGCSSEVLPSLAPVLTSQSKKGVSV